MPSLPASHTHSVSTRSGTRDTKKAHDSNLQLHQRDSQKHCVGVNVSGQKKRCANAVCARAVPPVPYEKRGYCFFKLLYGSAAGTLAQDPVDFSSSRLSEALESGALWRSPPPCADGPMRTQSSRAFLHTGMREMSPRNDSVASVAKQLVFSLPSSEAGVSCSNASVAGWPTNLVQTPSQRRTSVMPTTPLAQTPVARTPGTPRTPAT